MVKSIAQSPVQAVELSRNRKIGLVSATSASQASCPRSCPFYGNGCYASSGPQGIHTARLNKSDIIDPLTIAKMHAQAIDTLSGQLNLRLNVVGDSTTSEGTRLIADAAKRFIKRHNRKVWCYTHCHTTSRADWGEINILRSCETIKEVKQAFADGFAAALVVESFAKDTAYEVAPGLIGIPCPEMTGKAKSCVDCKLCMHTDRLLKNKRVILFAAHGARSKKVIQQVRDKQIIDEPLNLVSMAQSYMA